MAQIEIDHVHKVFKTAEQQDVVALRDINFSIKEGEFICLLGPSGCGKSTLLNAIAGFSLPTEGDVRVHGNIIKEPGPDRGMVFQEYALFPWMTVEDNIVFGLRIRNEDPTKIEKTLTELLQKLKLTEFRSRFPKDLSGGMRQRVAIARVLALDPPIMLMDEPFGALDALTRRSLQDELVKIWSETKKTVVFVTHSMEEAIYLADRIVVMTYRPGTVKKDIAVNIPRPRNPTDTKFNDLKKELTELVMAEQNRFQEAQVRGSTGD
ncbi:ABC transporter ATP-binding protein [Bdellovibrio svalbardensis]|uniref:ABC transporter ATP-binding protein n=1 Tax=Bdellovibrio svalbardensis TaxID=2972972 RepID=A0ABT6DGB3_9BACT|nr:ABC transporter ATP-binding protein [Bdellovibrio svalbardensis]MDG0815862.1 ABC transporter ATP-binding protein [Bdellovibrio svalbardensis]